MNNIDSSGQPCHHILRLIPPLSSNCLCYIRFLDTSPVDFHISEENIQCFDGCRMFDCTIQLVLYISFIDAVILQIMLKEYSSLLYRHYDIWLYWHGRVLASFTMTRMEAKFALIIQKMTQA